MIQLNSNKLKQAEAGFLSRYPGGFADPEMVKIGKRHPMAKMTAMVHDCFSARARKNIGQYAEDMAKVVGRSSMVSMFEKPKFRDFVKRLAPGEQSFLVQAMHDLLHTDNQQGGFEALVELLKTEKLAKWSLISIIPAYYAPTTEVFVKPTTAKNIIQHFDIEGLVYKPTPSWEFYTAYRDLINHAKTQVDSSLSPSNAAFSGFLMMAISSSDH
ncbi:hypothetical protein OAD32_03940 [Porticoccaceae bacterium]|nr:hypothetical protein [Porticoccaceae bacterium]MDB9949061.1 hypothetical protein [Porticoccaceae bacterium]